MTNLSLTLVLFISNAIFLTARTTVINIGGLFPLTSGDGFGSQELTAAILAISQANNKSDGIADTLLENFQVHPKYCTLHCSYYTNFLIRCYATSPQVQLISRNSRSTPVYAVLQAANIVGVDCFTDACQHAQEHKTAPILGFIGPALPVAVEKVQRLLQLPHIDVAQIAYSMTSPVLSSAGRWSNENVVTCIATLVTDVM